MLPRLYSSLLVLCLATLPAGAATVSGTGTYATADDLTLIDVGGGTVLEFLDLTATDGMSISQALTAFGADRFRVATVTEILDLLGAFSLPGAGSDVTTWSADSLSATPTAVASFQTAFGVTNTTVNDSFAGGYLDDGRADGEAALINVRTADSNSVFFNHVNLSGGGDDGAATPTLGVFLVRDALTTVPLPGSGAVLGLGLGALALRARARIV